ncbi:MAG: hypothetical protein K0U64_10470 [Actinomycetia bacterium]|nr:hypothetical protein [Actinomycetes bacterium]
MSLDRGGASIAIIVISAGVILICVALASIAALARVHAVVDAAADLSALAAANQLLVSTDPCAVARTVAHRNDVALDSCTISGAVVAVTVSKPLPAGVAALSGSRAVGDAYAQLQRTPGAWD